MRRPTSNRIVQNGVMNNITQSLQPWRLYPNGVMTPAWKGEGRVHSRKTIIPTAFQTNLLRLQVLEIWPTTGWSLGSSAIDACSLALGSQSKGVASSWFAFLTSSARGSIWWALMDSLPIHESPLSIEASSSLLIIRQSLVRAVRFLGDTFSTPQTASASSMYGVFWQNAWIAQEGSLQSSNSTGRSPAPRLSPS
jgi:hypothetical protein